MKVVKTWDESLVEVESIADALGLPIDEKIKPLVAALRMFGVRTTQSCEGHPDRGFPYPWVEIEADSDNMFATAELVMRQNRLKKTGGSQNRNTWVLLPKKRWRLVPLNPDRHLNELQTGVSEFAEFLRGYATETKT